MPTLNTKLDVWNMALDRVKEVPLGALTDARSEARWLNRNFEHVVEAALRSDLWVFAMEFHALNADGDYTATPRWAYRYSMPNGAIRLISPTYGGLRGGRPIAYEIRGNRIYAAAAAPLYVDFIMRELDVGQWDPLFVEVIVCTLAEGMAHRFTHKNSFVESARAAKIEALDIAAQTNAIEGGIEPAEVYDILRAREL